MKKIIIVFIVFLCACKSPQKLAGPKYNLPQSISLNGKLFSSLFMQRSAEYRALCFQAYNIARLRLDNYIVKTVLPKAIITDIDETILDNSPYAVHQAYRGKEYDAKSWYEWTDMATADTMPGAGGLLRYAASRNIEIFYITNREERARNSTLKNLQHFNLPNADDAHFFPRQATNSKEDRRLNIMKSHEVILLMGDNLADFSMLFDKKNEADRKANTDRSAADFGNKFIVFPNPNYGDWESSLYQFNYKLTQAQKDSVIKGSLRDY